MAGIVQLMSDKDVVLFESFINGNATVRFENLYPRTYHLKFIYDANRNRKWDTGDFDSGKQPEPVSFYFQNLEIKSGWSPEQDWDIGIKNFKDPKLRIPKKTR